MNMEDNEFFMCGKIFIIYKKVSVWWNYSVWYYNDVIWHCPLSTFIELYKVNFKNKCNQKYLRGWITPRKKLRVFWQSNITVLQIYETTEGNGERRHWPN